MVQVAHAAYESGLHGQTTDDTKSLVLCRVPNEFGLEKARDQLVRWNIPHVLFREPDIGNQATAIATLPLNEQQRKHLGNLQLWKPP